MHTINSQKIKVGISSCLLGEKVRYDSGHKRNGYINTVLSQYFEFKSFCPEVAIGLGIPRETIRLVSIDDQIRCVGTSTPTLDVTEKLYQSADDQKNWHQQLGGYILKKDSPSCGMERVRLYQNDMPVKKGVGLYAERLMDNFPNLPVEEEGRLEDPVIRENFLQRIFIYTRWKELCSEPLQWKHLTKFHAQHKYIYMSHNQNLSRELGSWLADNNKLDVDEMYQYYLTTMMTLLKVKASRKSHVNTLQHIQGYLTDNLEGDDKKELTDIIHNYRNGLVPLIVPITLLRHHFMHHPDSYITESHYMQPHPSELMLLNSL